MEAPKKISFGFKNTRKAEKPIIEENKDYIECVEEKAIKVIGGDIVEEKPDLVIPVKPNTLMTSAERLKQIAEQVEGSLEIDYIENTVENNTNAPKPVENETLDQMAARELLEDAKKEKKSDASALVLPVPSLPVIEGQKEASLEDYESVPISEFGMAMLRGMGWTSGKETALHKPPELRPKGLGLGADKVIKQNQSKSKAAKDEKGEELMLVKNAYVRVIMGKYDGLYGKVVSLDDDTGRVTVDLTLKKETVNINECMVQPVTKTEYEQQSRILNAEKYEEYKSKDKTQKHKSNISEMGKIREHQPSKSKQKSDAYSSRKHDEYDDGYKDRNYSSSKKERDRGNGTRRDSRSDDERHERRKERKYSSNDSISSDSDKHKYKQESKKRHSSVDSDSSDSYDKKRYKKKKSKKKSSVYDEKRDIDKKRKGKKKKRDRDRSPNYKKCKK